MKRLNSSFLRFLLIGSLCVLIPTSGEAGVLSKPLIWLGKKFGKSATKEIAKETLETIAQKELAQLSKKYGSHAVAQLDEVAFRTGIPKAELLKELHHFGDVYRRAGFSAEALEFGARHGEAGRFFVSRPDLFAAMKRSGCLEPKPEMVRVVNESWRLVGDGAGGSWKTLQQSLQGAHMNSGVSRDFCENLFVNRVKAGAHPAFPKGTELFGGHITRNGQEVRQGIDFLCPKKNEPLRVIEFGTGKKPSDALELSWDRIRKKLAEFVENAPNKDQLRGAGMPQELLNPKNLRDPNFPIHDFVTREIHAPEINLKLLKDLGLGKIKAFELP